ncbi:UrcA family protein [Sphingomonas sp. SUN039]|uniref:UrcA family protein n=1 Tax=Sphingomonas sp. SUN039 TaxID=2937787 RepID=UPI0021645135|nr:UrcA family protein [Sphingomonas sp. SUN039]UVO53965.1 UrcA family protein [Sphingomonas sp. SUN039]
MKMLLVASTILLAAAAPAWASPAETPVTSEVRTDDLNLGTAAGRTRLEARVGRAARQLCALSERGIAALDAEKRCVALAMKQAAPQVDLAVAKASSAVQIAALAPVRGG